MKSYIVTAIFEADYGCEGILEGENLQDIVCLKDEKGIGLKIKADDLELIRKNINEGDRVYFDGRGEIFKQENI